MNVGSQLRYASTVSRGPVPLINEIVASGPYEILFDAGKGSPEILCCDILRGDRAPFY